MMVPGAVATVGALLPEFGSSCFMRFLFSSFVPPGPQFVFHSCL